MTENGNAMTENGHTNGKRNAEERIFLWTNPRSVSTAFEKMVSFVDGCQMWHEPYVVPYFNSIISNPEHLKNFPRMGNVGRQLMQIRGEINEQKEKHHLHSNTLAPITEFTYESVPVMLDQPLKPGKKFIFVKDMGFAIDNHYDSIPNKNKWRHTFLIRNPRRLALSGKTLLRNVLEYGDEDFDMMYQQPFSAWEKLSPDPLFKYYNYVRENIDPNPLVIDADDLMNNTKAVLTKYFDALGLKWKDEYMKWDSSLDFIRNSYGCHDLVTWGIEQKAYDRAFYSSEFVPLKTPPMKWADMSDDTRRYASEYEDGYRVMWDNRIRP